VRSATMQVMSVVPSVVRAKAHSVGGATFVVCDQRAGLSAAAPPGAVGVTADNVLYYCARLQYTDAYMWSLTPGTIPNPIVTAAGPSPGDPCAVLHLTTQDAVGADDVVQSNDDCDHRLVWQYGGPG